MHGVTSHWHLLVEQIRVSYSSPPVSLVIWPTRAWTIIADDLLIDLSTPTAHYDFRHAAPQ
jgi:hypothetical protein